MTAHPDPLEGPPHMKVVSRPDKGAKRRAPRRAAFLTKAWAVLVGMVAPLCLCTLLQSRLYASEPPPMQAWEARYNHPFSDESARAVTTDAAGNVYVTGSGIGPRGSRDFVTLKYDPDGIESWRAYYGYEFFGLNGECHPDFQQGEDEPMAIAVDGSGNVYVAGTTYLSYCCGTNHFFEESWTVIVKYNPEGNLLWSYPVVYTDEPVGPVSMVVDEAGNLYVAANEGGAYLTMRFGSGGIGSGYWEARYRGPGLGYSVATGIAVDALGNVYVTGRSRGIGTGYDFATIKYDPEGNELWVTRYDGPAGGDDKAASIAVTPAGEVLVTGVSTGPARAAGGSDRDIVTIRYDPDGTEWWTARYAAPAGMAEDKVFVAVDDQGDAFVAGTIEDPSSGRDIVTVRYDRDGSEAWTARYNGPGDRDDTVSSIALTSIGDVVVAGRTEGTGSSGESGDYVTICYASFSGIEIWRRYYDGPAGTEDAVADAAADAAGNVVVSGTSQGDGTGADYATVKYDPNGGELWTRRFENPGMGGFDEWPVAMALDPWGNVLVAGNSRGPSSRFESDHAYVVAKYTPEGNRLWTARHDCSGEVRDMAVDNEGNILLAGSGEGGGSGQDYLIVKYGPNGDMLWTARYDGDGHGWDQATALALDATGNVYVTGTSTGAGGGAGYATLKYDPEGNMLWATRYGDDEGGGITAEAIALDGASNVYVTGGGGAYVTVKYDPDGNELWSARFNGPGEAWDEAVSVGIDASGNVYVTGTSHGNGTGPDYATIKYDPEGNELWAARFDGAEYPFFDHVYTMAVDPSGDVYVAGVTGTGGPSEPDLQIATIKYDPNGNELWVARYGDRYFDTLPSDMVTDASGAVYVAGTWTARSLWACGRDSSDGVILKYDPSGTMQWDVIYDGPFLGLFDDGRDGLDAIVLDDGGDIYVTGSIEFQGTGLDMATMRYTRDLPCNDLDGDGYGTAGTPQCTHPEGDCDDTDPNVNPGNLEDDWQECHNGVDDDCDGFADWSPPLPWGPVPCACNDLDGDGYGEGETEEMRAGCAYPGRDCDNHDPGTYPGAPELCDGRDNQCPGEEGSCRIDEGCPCSLLGPNNGAALADAPVLEWTACDQDAFGLFLLLPIVGRYYLLPVWSPCSSMDLGRLGMLWSFIDEDRWAGWGVLGINLQAENWDWRGWRWFRKTSAGTR